MRKSAIYALVLAAIAIGIRGQSSRREKEQICTPGSKIDVDCNTCICLRDGTTWDCTQMACLTVPVESSGPDDFFEVPRPTIPILRKKEAKVCEPGSMREVGCKICHCSIDGMRELCVGRCRQPVRLRRDVSSRCEPNSKFRKDCNHCICSTDGSFASCTFKLCISRAIDNISIAA